MITTRNLCFQEPTKFTRVMTEIFGHLVTNRWQWEWCQKFFRSRTEEYLMPQGNILWYLWATVQCQWLERCWSVWRVFDAVLMQHIVESYWKLTRFSIKSYEMCESNTEYVWSFIIWTEQGTELSNEFVKFETNKTAATVSKHLKPLSGPLTQDK